MVHWVDAPMPGRLGIMARPRGGDWLATDVRRLREDGVQVLVSLLEPVEVHALGLAQEEDLATSEGLVFLALPIPDRQIPPDAHAFRHLVAQVGEHVASGAGVAIHCRAGIGRSSVLAAAVLAAQGISVPEAFDILSACRGFEVPDTEEQRTWVARFVAARLYDRSAPDGTRGDVGSA